MSNNALLFSLLKNFWYPHCLLPNFSPHSSQITAC